MKSKLTIFVLIVVLTILTAIPATAAPLVGPCAPGTAYDPACDVDQDGDVDIFDIQLTASRWNRTGTWVSDNDHDHLGQTWVGNNNPLRIQGNFGPPNEAPLVLSSRATLFRACVVVYLLAGGGFDRIDTFIGPARGVRVCPL